MTLRRRHIARVLGIANGAFVLAPIVFMARISPDSSPSALPSPVPAPQGQDQGVS